MTDSLIWGAIAALEIVRAGGITRAAAEMSRKQSAISLPLKKLEDHLGVKLCCLAACAGLLLIGVM